MPIQRRAGKTAFKSLTKWNLEPKSKRNNKILINLLTGKKITKQLHFINKARRFGLTVSEANALWKKYFSVK